MPEIMEFLHQFNYVTVIIRLALAVLCGGIVGLERGRHGSAAGLRTHILVCVGSVMTALIGCFVRQELGIEGDVLRVSAQVVSGIGFLGAGMIIVRNNSTVTGLTTAAGMWATASIGIALGFGFYSGALLATVLCIVAAAFFSAFERKRKDAVSFYIEVDADKTAGDLAEYIRESLDRDAVIKTVPANSNLKDVIGVCVSMHNATMTPEQIRKDIQALEGVRFAVEE